MITLGGRCRFGVPGPLGDPPIALNLSGATIVFPPGFSEFREPDCGCSAGGALAIPPSFGGSGLFLESLSAVVDDEGVATGDCAASRELLDCEGDDVPSFESLFFDFDALLGSFARESCSC